MFLFGTTIADWLMKSATNARKVGTNNSRARPSNHVTRFKQDPCPRPFCMKFEIFGKIWNYQIESTNCDTQPLLYSRKSTCSLRRSFRLTMSTNRNSEMLNARKAKQQK